MIKLNTTWESVPDEALSERERGQLTQKKWAKLAWSEGRPYEALQIIDDVVDKPMSPRVALECLIAQGAFRAEVLDYPGSLESLAKASEHLDAGSPYVQACFFFQRARSHKETGNIDAAFTDYAGAGVIYEQIGNWEHVGTVSKNLAGLCLQMGDLPRASEHIERAISIYEQIGSKRLGQAYDTKANILLAEGKVGFALAEIDKALSLGESNDLWRQTYEHTKVEIREKIFEVMVSTATIKDLKQIEIKMVARALERSNGSVTKTASILGVTHKAIASFVKNNKLEHLRTPAQPRRKSICKK